MDAPQQAWHYTTAAGLLSIIGRSRLWATSAAFMNDRDEILIGRHALQAAIDNHVPPLEKWQLDQLSRLGVMKEGDAHRVFLLCAALDGDALTLWRSYGVGSEAEYAIELDATVALLPVEQNDLDFHPEPAPPGWGDDAKDFDDEGRAITTYDVDQGVAYGGDWGNVDYLDVKSFAARDLLENLLRGMKKPKPGHRTIPFFLDFLAGPDPTVMFKHPGVSDEVEVRATWAVQPWWRFVLYRAGRFGITPYIEVASKAESVGQIGYENFLRTDQVGRLPIRSIRIGPTGAADIAEKSLRAFLDANGYGDVRIERSSTPYR
ncbi:hypothetical protein [Frondihabitans cladoniiphilus]|uniref:DUF2971 family protein n=1 Tax=Frondihabitans cladoniiphilus TaxID=715785 RepID=A0ABP8W412_9MICO